MKTRIITGPGRSLDLHEPRPEDVDIRAIAWSLSRMPRFCGHQAIEVTYTVLEHSIWMYTKLKDENEQTRLWALLHDAHEAYIGDIPAPAKLMLEPEIDALVESLDIVIMDAICPEFDWSKVDMRLIDTLDRHAGALEAWQFCHWSIEECESAFEVENLEQLAPIVRAGDAASARWYFDDAIGGIVRKIKK